MRQNCFFLLKFIFALLFAAVQAYASGAAVDEDPGISFSPKLQKAYFEIQKLRIQTARDLIDTERKSNPDNAFIPFLDNYADLHQLLISEDRAAYKQWSAQEDRRLSHIGKLPDASPYKRFLQAEIRLHWAFAKLKFGNEISGSWDIIKAYKLLEENRKRFPKFLPTLKSLGLLHVLIGSIPENYTWITKVLGLKGNIQGGIAELRLVAREEPLFRQESELIDLLLHAYTLKLSPVQLARIRSLPKEHPDNLLLHFFATTISMKEGRSDEAASYLADAPSGNTYIAFPFLNYLRAEILLQKGAYRQAFDTYLLFQKQYKGFNYVKDCSFKLFMCLWLSNEDARAVEYIAQVPKSGSTIIEADQFAQKFAEAYSKGQIPAEQKVLFRARYATDGGYLDKAAALMQEVSETTFRTISDKCEYNYRLARILQKSGQQAKSVRYYERAIALSAGSSSGFAPSSALQLGYISLETGDTSRAINQFKKAMSYKNHEYKNSIDNKARAALTGLGE